MRLSRSQQIVLALFLIVMAPFRVASGAELLPLRATYSSIGGAFAPLWLAQDKGLFTKYGLAVELKYILSATGTQALFSGSIDIVNPATEIVEAGLGGQRVAFIIGILNRAVLSVYSKAEFRQLTDLRGKVMGVTLPGSTTDLTAKILFQQAGMVPGKDIHLLPSGDDNGRFASLETGRVDAVIGGPPLNMWGAKKNYKVIAWAKDYTNLPQNAVIVTDKKIQQAPDQAKRMIKGTIEALRFIQTNKKEAIEILASYSRSDRETATGMFESYFPAYSRDGAMTNEALQAAVDDAVIRAKLEKKIPLSQVADRTLLMEAQRELGIK